MSYYKKCHLSIDDVSSCLINLSTKSDSYKSLFEEPFFGFLLKLHNSYRASFTLYAYEDLCVDVEENKIYTFGVYLSKDKKNVIPYLDIKKIINNKINNTAYVVSLEYGNMKKKIYLERIDNNKYYSYENSIPFEDLFKNEKTIDIKLSILFLDLKEKV